MSEPTEQRIRDIIAGSDVVLFMKGVPAAPQCGFSGSVVQILNGLGVPFTGLDMIALTNDFTLADQNTTYHGVGMR